MIRRRDAPVRRRAPSSSGRARIFTAAWPTRFPVPGAPMGHHGGVPSMLRRRSAVFLVYLHQLPRWVPLVVFPAMLIAGLAVPGPIGAALLAVLAIILWFTFI